MVEELSLSAHQTLRVLPSSPGALELESTWLPGGRPPRTHWHPTQREEFEVLEGALTVELAGRPPRVLEPHETLVVPPRTAHRMWNASTEVTRAGWRVTPAQQTEEMFRAIAGGVNPVTAVVLVWRYRRELRLGRPPRASRGKAHERSSGA
ncbi:Cupin domain-containing protein [Friedmanniella luteola]|uniref:Cupin domain-containing protein n=1 Tax=Friedmanniella luteola TaxID=546871 RepID=A0A1H1T1M5_9ACTN|nr:cupin domain-containing protein [Friedmanniella luteola]SDS54048.1 Cupin domain-containing protein [Friedmanniella luteola]